MGQVRDGRVEGPTLCSRLLVLHLRRDHLGGSDAPPDRAELEALLLTNSTGYRRWCKAWISRADQP
jgi:hypothetical protein